VLRTMGPFETVFNSPSHHRVHHGSNVRYLDRNHAGTLIIWDRIFGSFEAEDEAERPVYGLTKNLNSYNPVRIAFAEWINMAHDVMNAPTWRAKLRYVFAPPGWSHDGRSKTSDEMRASNLLQG
jgi:hypothetical protein